MQTIGASKLNVIDSMSFEPSSKGTKMEYSVDYKVSCSILGKLIDKLRVRKRMEEEDRRFLEKIKMAVEA